MTRLRAVDDVIGALPGQRWPQLPAPAYTGKPGPCVGLAVESMRRHMTDEGWLLMAGLEAGGYTLHGHAIGPSLTDVRAILARERPGTVLIQDKREYIGKTAGPGFDRRETFTHAGTLSGRPDIFRGTVIKDAQNDGLLHIESAKEIGAHFWVTPYHPRIVHHLAPFTRPEHLVRTYHTVDAEQVPAYSAAGRSGCILSGAVSAVYPLRKRLADNAGALYHTTHHRHPGYHRRGPATPEYLRTLSRFRVSICTSSVFGYALRKIVEAVACGCRVITDLPTDDVLPGGIDAALVRVPPSISVREVSELIRHLCDTYDPERQGHYAALALARYDWRVEGVRLAGAIEELRRGYVSS